MLHDSQRNVKKLQHADRVDNIRRHALWRFGCQIALPMKATVNDSRVRNVKNAETASLVPAYIRSRRITRDPARQGVAVNFSQRSAVIFRFNYCAFMCPATAYHLLAAAL